MSNVTGALTSRADPPIPQADPQRAIEYYGDLKDADAALAYVQALRCQRPAAQAAVVFEQACIANPGNKALLAGCGRALADNGDLQQAQIPARDIWSG